ncbi:hypothetical protein CFC21_095387 [Triticum aestivum]|uniref:Uncharacterized protein n=2 Tax=Triticum aestivum TaxID=4565 RepID=A0A3B6RB76_WHEAT|nr:hypothetical protein CFC21_095387 [Triticum aestivum]
MAAPARALTAARARPGPRLFLPPPASIDPVCFCFRSGASMNHSSASAQREDERGDAHGPAAEAMTGAQVEAALNRKNVEVLQGEEEEHLATVLPDDTIGEGALDLDGGEDASWVPDQGTGVFVPADANADADDHCGGAHPATPHLYGGATPGGSTASVLELDQAVFVREEEMEDVERPAMDLTDANGGSNN